MYKIKSSETRVGLKVRIVKEFQDGRCRVQVMESRAFYERGDLLVVYKDELEKVSSELCIGR